MKSRKNSKYLPEIVAQILETKKEVDIVHVKNEDAGDTGGFLRLILRLFMKDEGKIPPEKDK